MALAVAGACSGARARPANASTTATTKTPAASLVRSYIRDWRLDVHTTRVKTPRLIVPNLPLAKGNPAGSDYGIHAVGSIEEQLNDGRVACFGIANQVHRYNLRFDMRVQDRIRELRLLGTTEPSYCPFWDWEPPAPRAVDGTNTVVPRLPEEAQQRLADRKRALLVALDAILDNAPTDSVALGQRVRFSTTSEEVAAAQRHVAKCVPAAYCTRLRAYVELRLGRDSLADSLYRIARAQLDKSTACRQDGVRVIWPRASPLLPDTASCASYSQRRELLWWLANPRWNSALDVRRLAHENRLLDVLLRDQVGLDEYLDFSSGQRSTAEALVLRYGFPRRTGARQWSVAGAEYEWYPRDGDEKHRSFGAPQYSLDYYRTIPAAAALEHPFDATMLDFSVRAPGPQFNLRAEFPEELIDAEPRLHDLTGAQLAHFMRDSMLVLTVAVPPPPPSLAARMTRAYRATFMSSTQPGVIDVLASATSDSATAFRFLGLTAPTASVLSVEVESALTPVSDVWRARFGQRPAASLVVAASGAPAMSDVLLIDATADSLGGGMRLEQATRQMLTSSVLTTQQRRLGLFWELYGIPAGARLRYTVTVSSSQGANVLSRVFAFARGQTATTGDAVAITLSKLVDERTVTRTQRNARIVADGLVLNLADLPPGDYVLGVTAVVESTTGAQPFRAESRRAIRIAGN